MQAAIDSLSDVLTGCANFKLLVELCSSETVYLVGGAIRDALVGRPVVDLDLIFPGDPTPLAKKFARQIGGHWFWLDPQRLQSRVVVDQADGGLHYDFARFRAPTLEQDLRDRDFTINALALPLAASLPAAALIDPCNGLADLRRRMLCMVGEDAFANDPLRVIKGVRHATVLGMEIEAETLLRMRSAVAGLDRVAPERIRQELWKILADRNACRGIRLLAASGAGEQLFGPDFAGALRPMTESLATCRQQWRRFAARDSRIATWLAREVEQGLSNETLLSFAFLLACVERDLPARLADRWRLSRKARRGIGAATALDVGAVRDFMTIGWSARAYAWWSARYDSDPKLLLLALAASPDATAFLLDIESWVPLVATLDGDSPKDLVDGDWLRDELHLEEGPAMTTALELLRNAEIYGEVNNPQEARRFLLRHYQNRD